MIALPPGGEGPVVQVQTQQVHGGGEELHGHGTEELREEDEPKVGKSRLAIENIRIQPSRVWNSSNQA